MTEEARHRPDGWPLCPRCGEDELADCGYVGRALMAGLTIDQARADPLGELFCYSCLWRGRAPPPPLKLLQFETKAEREARLQAEASAAAEGERQAEVVQQLERLLEQARTGEFVGALHVLEHRDGCLTFATTRSPDVRHRLGSLVALLLKEWFRWWQPE